MKRGVLAYELKSRREVLFVPRADQDQGSQENKHSDLRSPSPLALHSSADTQKHGKRAADWERRLKSAPRLAGQILLSE